MIIFYETLQEWPQQTKPKKGEFMNFSQGHSGTKVRYVNRACFPKEKHQNSYKNGRDSYELFLLAPFFGLVCRGESYETIPNTLLKKKESDVAALTREYARLCHQRIVSDPLDESQLPNDLGVADTDIAELYPLMQGARLDCRMPLHPTP